jgi:hypothetical protein
MSKWIYTVAAVGSLIASTAIVQNPASAANLVLNNGHITAIQGLNVSGTLYDVDFRFGSYNDVFTNTNLTPTFLGNVTGATAAARAITDLGNDFTPFKQFIDDINGTVYNNAYVPSSVFFSPKKNEFRVSHKRTYCDKGVTVWNANGCHEAKSLNTPLMFPIFTPAASLSASSEDLVLASFSDTSSSTLFRTAALNFVPSNGRASATPEASTTMFVVLAGGLGFFFKRKASRRSIAS